VLARLAEQAADARGAEAGEHLDERGRRLREELRAGLVGDGLGEQRLAGAGRAVQEDALGHRRAEPLERFSVAQELDDLLSSSLASSTPAMSSQPTSRLACGLIWTGLVFGITFSVRQRTKTIAAMKRTVSTVAHWAKKSWMRAVSEGPSRRHQDRLMELL
jgi:hypothetical protein